MAGDMDRLSGKKGELCFCPTSCQNLTPCPYPGLTHRKWRQLFYIACRYTAHILRAKGPPVTISPPRVLCPVTNLRPSESTLNIWECDERVLCKEKRRKKTENS